MPGLLLHLRRQWYPLFTTNREEIVMSNKYDARELAVEYLRRSDEKFTAGEYIAQVLELEKAYQTYLQELDKEKVLSEWAVLGRKP